MSRSYEWETPNQLFEELNREFEFTLDPCSTPENAKCERYFTVLENGLKQDWSKDVVFMNPPYGREIGKWMAKAYNEWKKGATVVCLIPSRTDTDYWHRYAMKGELRFIKRRLKFGGGKSNAPFPSAIVVFSGLQRPRFYSVSTTGIRLDV